MVPSLQRRKLSVREGMEPARVPTAWKGQQQWDFQALGWLSAHSALAETSGPSGGSRVTLVLTRRIVVRTCGTRQC